MENPHSFISQLRDHNLIPEDKYKKMSRMKSKENMKKSLYDVLDWLERERPKYIKDFWKCVFKEIIMNLYPTMRLLRNRLLDGSFHFDIQLPERVEKEETGESEEEEEEKSNPGTKKRKLRSRSVCDEEGEPASPSSKLTPGQKKKNKKISFSSPLKKGEKGDIWTWALYKVQLPVTCGHQEGTLHRDRLAEGEKCIVVGRRWFTPTEFERFAGRESFKNWKLSIRCMDTPLAKLIRGGHLKATRYKGKFKKRQKNLLPAHDAVTVSDAEEDGNESGECDLDNDDDQGSSSSKESSANITGDEETETEQHSEAGHDSKKKVFKVTCGAVAATLHVKRFASGFCGKSIRTEERWMTPMEFVNEASGHADTSWRKDIQCEGKPLGVLTEKIIHSLQCDCRLCKPDSEDMDNQKNDDECSICKSGEEEELVMCDSCPRSFHQKCHLPHVEDNILKDCSVWMCTLCVFKKSKEWFFQDELKREAALSTQMSKQMLRCQYLLLCLCCFDEEQTFATNPNTYINDYSAVIKTPMWLSKVADKLQKQLYQTVGEFVSDVQLIFTNCASYNRDNAEFLAQGSRLKEFFDKEFTDVFNICD